MASTVFVDKVTVLPTEWCNEVNTLVHTILGNATNAAEARTALGLVIGTDVHAHDSAISQNTTGLNITSGQSVGIGTAAPDTNLHIWNASAGAVSAAANSLLTLENNANNYLQFLTPNNETSGINFGDVDNNVIGGIYYNHTLGRLTFVVEGSSPFIINSSGDITIGTTCAFFDISANTLQIGKGLSTASAVLELGTGRTGNGQSSIELIGDATYTDFGTSLARYNVGPNSNSVLEHRGTGELRLIASDAGSITAYTSSILALTIDSAQKLGIGIGTPDTKVHIASGSAGAVAAAGGSIVTIETNGGNNYLNFLSPNTGDAGLIVGDVDDNNVAEWRYDHANTYWNCRVETVSAMRVDNDSTAGNTRLLIYDVDNATLERVSVGAADSGGTGYKVLRILN